MSAPAGGRALATVCIAVGCGPDDRMALTQIQIGVVIVGVTSGSDSHS